MRLKRDRSSSVNACGASRSTRPRGAPTAAETVNGLGNRKNDIVQRRIREDGVQVYDGSVRYLHAVRAAGLRTAVVSSSANTAEVLQVTGLTELFDAMVDGQVARERHLP